MPWPRQCPRAVEPVKVIMSMPGCTDMASPTEGVAVDQVEHAGRHARFVQDLGHQDGVQRRDLRGLEHHGAARRQGRCHLAHDLVDGPIPGRDHAHHAHGLMHDAGGAAHALELEVPEHLQGLLQVPCAHRGPGPARDSHSGAPISSEMVCATSSMRRM